MRPNLQCAALALGEPLTLIIAIGANTIGAANLHPEIFNLYKIKNKIKAMVI